MHFKGFDFSHFWDDCEYARKKYICDLPSDQLIADIEEELGYKLPDSYLWLMKQHNGGIPFPTCFPTLQPANWAISHVAINGIMGIGRDKTYSLCGELGSQFMIDEWEYPAIGVAVCTCPSGGHDMIFLDYRECGPQGEPRVVHIDQERDYKITPLADNFEAFIQGLVSEDELDEYQPEPRADEFDECSLEPEDFQEKLQHWYEWDEHQKIIDAIRAIPESELDFDLIGQLGRALNNADLYDEAIAILKTAEDQGQDDAIWNFRMGYAYCYRTHFTEKKKADYEAALACFVKAKALGDDDTDDFIELCTEELNIAEEIVPSSAKSPAPSKVTQTRGERGMEKFDENYVLLEDMVDDDYYPPFLVEKIKGLMLPIIRLLEGGETNEEIIQKKLDEMTLAINELQADFDANDSDLETIARDSIAVTIGYILGWFRIDIDMETALQEREW